jgi:hypothetical protein
VKTSCRSRGGATTHIEAQWKARQFNQTQEVM